MQSVQTALFSPPLHAYRIIRGGKKWIWYADHSTKLVCSCGYPISDNTRSPLTTTTTTHKGEQINSAALIIYTVCVHCVARCVCVRHQRARRTDECKRHSTAQNAEDNPTRKDFGRINLCVNFLLYAFSPSYTIHSFCALRHFHNLLYNFNCIPHTCGRSRTTKRSELLKANTHTHTRRMMAIEQ